MTTTKRFQIIEMLKPLGSKTKARNWCRAETDQYKIDDAEMLIRMSALAEYESSNTNVGSKDMSCHEFYPHCSQSHFVELVGFFVG
jgi:hypothetical protein